MEHSHQGQDTDVEQGIAQRHQAAAGEAKGTGGGRTHPEEADPVEDADAETDREAAVTGAKEEEAKEAKEAKEASPRRTSPSR